MDAVQRRLDARINALERAAMRARANRYHPYLRNPPAPQQTSGVENLARVVIDISTAVHQNPWTSLGMVAGAAYAMGRHPVRLFFDVAFAFMPSLPLPRMPVWPALPVMPVMPTFQWPW
jgi:hypothetical protein